MKKVTSIFFAVILSGFTVFSVSGQTKPGLDIVKLKKAKIPVQYTCTMHPEVISNKPGKCPKCGMTLIKKTTAKVKPSMGKMKM
ncbi:heavy metal-binding domain-containing protein [Pedobacter sp. UYP1]|uniref:heavy metal-binding domain-containing protein n=1 Tax=Pedobacter sp. UYP1 TaxID=1756396 RepID=UPI003393A01B